MKVLILFTFLLPTMLFAQQTYIPDDRFEQILIDGGFDEGPLNDSVPTANIKDIVDLNLHNRDIHDLTGIEDFISLIVLKCDNNELTILDLSNNKNLQKLICSNNKIKTLDLSENILLEYVNCYNNGLLSLELSTLDKLYELSCGRNNLKTIDLTNSHLLKHLNCYYNRLQTLDLSNNPELETLFCTNNLLFDIDLSNNPLLKEIICHTNNLTAIDISNNRQIETLSFRMNQLRNVNLQNGNNINIKYLDVRNNEHLFCILVDDPLQSENMKDWKKDRKAEYSTNCDYTNDRMVYVPDDNFENALRDIDLDDELLNDSVPYNNIKYLQKLDISNQNIHDLTGIGDFYNLDTLLCNSNNIENLDLRYNRKLTYLSCNRNPLYYFNIKRNQIIQHLDCYSNDLYMLDISQLQELEYLDCSDNLLYRLDLNNGNNKNLDYLKCNNNLDLNCITVDDPNWSMNAKNWLKDNHSIYSDNCNQFDTRMTFVPDDNFKEELYQYIGYNNQTNDSVPTAMIEKIELLLMHGTGIRDLTGIEDFASLELLYCDDNPITHLDLSNNKRLETLNVSLANLEGLDLRNGNNTILSYCSATKNENLLCIQVDDPNWSTSQDSWFKDEHAVYSEDCSTVDIPEEPTPTFTISPNPATDLINIETESLSEEIEIYNMLGIPVLKVNGSGQIDVSGLPRGIYYVKIDDQTYKKLILH